MTLWKDTRLGGHGGSVGMWSLKRALVTGSFTGSWFQFCLVSTATKEGVGKILTSSGFEILQKFLTLKIYGLVNEGSLCLRAKPRES